MLNSALEAAIMERTPIWAAGAQDWWDFTRSGRAKRGVGEMPAETRAADAYVENEAGGYVLRSPNTRLMAGKGMLTFQSRTQLFVSPSAPATQTITVANGTVYTVDVFGGGSVTLSGAGTGSASPGSSRTFTASGTSLTVTVSGSPTWVNVSAGAFGVQPLLAGTTNGPVQVIDIGSRAALGVGGVIQVDVLEPAPTGGIHMLRFSDGTPSNTMSIFFNAAAITCAITRLGVSQGGVSVPASTVTGRMTLAFAYGADFFTARVVGQSAATPDESATYPSVNRLGLGGTGYHAAANVYQLTKRLGLWYGPMSAHFFDNVLWPKAQLLAQVA